MRCPDCTREMMIVTLGTTPAVKLDACDWCGGVWADQSETNFIQQSDLVALPITSSMKTPNSRSCPKDNTNLIRFRGESVPENVFVYRCQMCGGSWFPNGNLRKFKKAQSAKLSFFKTWHIPLSSAYAILLPILLIFIISGGLFITVKSIGEQQQLESQAAALVGKPVVRFISSTEVFISFSTKKPMITSLTYWKIPSQKKTIVISTSPKTTHTIRLSNLSPNTTYFYQISTEIFSFTTRKY